MDEPQPGLLPIIPRNFRLFGEGPSPLIPVIILVIVGGLRWMLLSMMEVVSSIEPPEVPDWDSMADSVHSQFTMTVFLVPVVLLLAIHAFRMPQGNPVGNDHPDSFTQNLWSTVLLVVVIMVLLMSISTRTSVPPPARWQQQPDAPPPQPIYTTPSYGSWRGGYTVNGICQELGILQRRCENWKGYSRDSVCRDLAKLQKRCERAGGV